MTYQAFAVGLVRIFCSFLRVLSISQGLDAETYANDLIKNKNSTYWSRNFSCKRVVRSLVRVKVFIAMK